MAYDVAPRLSNAAFLRHLETQRGFSEGGDNEGEITQSDMFKDLYASKQALTKAEGKALDRAGIFRELLTVGSFSGSYSKKIQDYAARWLRSNEADGINKSSFSCFGEKPPGPKPLDSFFDGGRSIGVCHDAGLSPEKSITLDPGPHIFIQTGANIFDEGAGGKGKTRYVSVPTDSTRIHFGPDIMQMFGFKNLDVHIILTDTVYTIVIKHNGGLAAGGWTLIDSGDVNNQRVPTPADLKLEFGGVDDPINYFEGNATKNDFIKRNLGNLRDSAMQIQIMKYLVAKALGDLLQVLILIAIALSAYKEFLRGVLKIVLQWLIGFSGDRVYSSRLMKCLPEFTGCMYQSPGNDNGVVTSTLYYKGEEAPDAVFRRAFNIYKEQVLAHNRHITFLLRLAISDNQTKAGEMLDFTTLKGGWQKKLLVIILDSINKATEAAERIDFNMANNDANRAQLTQYKAIEFILYTVKANKSKLYRILPCITRLFVASGIDGTTLPFDPLVALQAFPSFGGKKTDLITILHKNIIKDIVPFVSKRYTEFYERGGAASAGGGSSPALAPPAPPASAAALAPPASSSGSSSASASPEGGSSSASALSSAPASSGDGSSSASAAASVPVAGQGGGALNPGDAYKRSISIDFTVLKRLFDASSKIDDSTYGELGAAILLDEDKNDKFTNDTTHFGQLIITNINNTHPDPKLTYDDDINKDRLQPKNITYGFDSRIVDLNNEADDYIPSIIMYSLYVQFEIYFNHFNIAILYQHFYDFMCRTYGFYISDMSIRDFNGHVNTFSTNISTNYDTIINREAYEYDTANPDGGGATKAGAGSPPPSDPPKSNGKGNAKSDAGGGGGGGSGGGSKVGPTSLFNFFGEEINGADKNFISSQSYDDDSATVTYEPPEILAGGSRKKQSRKNKNRKNKTRKTNNRKYNRRTRRKHH
jgi:hypothetical protein